MRLAIVGMGLIGGSLFKAARRAGHVVAGFDKGDPVDVSRAEVVFLALHPRTAVEWVRVHSADIPDGAVVVDTCGIKGPVCAAIGGIAASARWLFVGGHPMAGKEVSGFANSDADLFRGASMILTPVSPLPDEKLTLLERLFSDLGFGGTAVTTPARHDELIAYTSQLCHIISSAYLREPLSASHRGFSAGSFRDLTRVGAPDPVLWSELFADNREALLPVLDRFIGRLNDFRDAIAAGDTDALKQQISEGATAKATI